MSLMWSAGNVIWIYKKVNELLKLASRGGLGGGWGVEGGVSY